MRNDRLSSWFWLALGMLYLVAAVLSLLLAVAMSTWSPLLATAASALAATQCVLTGLERAPADEPLAERQ